jgi:hypothetical protein
MNEFRQFRIERYEGPGLIVISELIMITGSHG